MKNRGKLKTIFTVIILAVVGILVFLGFKTPVVSLMPGRTLTVEGVFGCKIQKEDIVSVEYVDTLPAMNRTWGFGIGTYRKGTFSSSELGRGKAYLKTDNPPYILLKLEDSNDKFLLINMYDKEKTEDLYYRIDKWLKQTAWIE